MCGWLGKGFLWWLGVDVFFICEVFLVAGWLVEAMVNGFFGGWMGVWLDVGK